MCFPGGECMKKWLVIGVACLFVAFMVSGCNDSLGIGTVESPVITPDGGDYILGESVVSITSPTKGASVMFSTDGGYSFQNYIGPFTMNDSLPKDDVIVAYAQLSGMYASAKVMSGTFKEKSAAPTIEVPGESLIPGSSPIKLACTTSGSTIWYSWDGEHFIQYETTTPLTMSEGRKTLTVISKKKGAGDSDAVAKTLNASYAVAMPKLSKPSGEVDFSEPLTASCSTPGSTIHYTMGTTTPADPSAGSPAFPSSLLLTDADTCIVKMLATASGLSDSDVATYTFSKATVQAPTITPDGGSIAGTGEILVSCGTKGVTYHYTWKGGTEYTWKGTQPSITLGSDESGTLSLYATKEGMKQSATVKKTFTNENVVQKPVFSRPDSSTFDFSEPIIITCPTEGATIFYTLDGTKPTTSSPTKGASGLSVLLLGCSSPVTLQAIAKAAQGTTDVVYAKYSMGTVADVIISPKSTDAIPVVFGQDKITFSCKTSGATIYYTTNGNEPSSSSLSCKTGESITLSASGTVKAMAKKDGLISSVNTTSQVFTQKQVSKPTITPSSGAVVIPDETKIAIDCATSGAVVTYTVNGGSSITYTAPFTLSTSQLPATIAAKATCAGWKDSESADSGSLALMPSTDYLSYLETGSNERTIIKYTGTAASVTIPTSIGGGNVTAIGDSAFKGNGTLTNVSIPETVRTIGDYAFAGCSKLKTVSIPRSLRTIGSWVFSGCGSLSSLTLPDGVTSIGEDLCINCSDLMSVTLPSTLTVIPESMFYGCTNLTVLAIPSTVTMIGERAFYDCSSLPTVTLPSGITTIGGYAFHGCAGFITKLTIPSSITIIGDHVFHGCSSLQSVEFAGNVTAFGIGAFQECGNLSTLAIPTTTKTIGAMAFNGCKSLVSIDLHACTALGSIGASAFGDCENLKDIGSLPNSLTDLAGGAFSGCKSLMGKITIPTGITKVTMGLFSGCESITSIGLPSTITEIQANAFANCKAMTDINLPIGITAIGEGAFSGCESLVSTMDIPSKVVVVAKNVFNGCKALTEITLPNGVVSIGEHAFEHCEHITSMQIPQGISMLDAHVFDQCSNLRSVELPDSLTSIGGTGGCTFNACKSLVSITLPSNVSSIAADSFKDCSKLASFRIVGKTAAAVKAMVGFSSWGVPSESVMDGNE